MSTATRWFTCTVLALSLGLHWALLQSVAWTGMFIRFSRQFNVVEALQKTFDGHHPCSLCKFVQATDRNSQSSDVNDPPSQLPKSKMDPAPLPYVHWTCQAPAVQPESWRPSRVPRGTSWEPPDPPPRALV